MFLCGFASYGHGACVNKKSGNLKSEGTITGVRDGGRCNGDVIRPKPSHRAQLCDARKKYDVFRGYD